MKPAENSIATLAKPAKETAPENDLKVIDDLAESATPRQIQQWIARLEQLFEQKKVRVRKDLQDRVSDMIALNGYTLEELFSTRVLPSTTELADTVRKAVQVQRERADKLAETAIRN